MIRLLLTMLALGLVAASTVAEEKEGRLQFTENDLPTDEKDPAGLSEIDEFAQRQGFNYAKDTRRAARGDAKALRKFFQIAHDADGAAAESITGMPTVVYHLLGDEKFAKFLAAQPLAYRMMVRNMVGDQEFIGDFPLSARLLYQREMNAWASPNDLYAIRKVFSDEFELAGSKVERAELIEKKSGRVLCDLTPDDIGTGGEREGEALWSPDSKRVACLSSDLTPQEGNLSGTPRPAPLRKQTAVYQLSGDKFIRVDLSLDRVPGRENDDELKGAILVHEYTEPVRWQKPNVLILRRHEHYRKSMPTKVDNLTFDSIHDLERSYEITASIDAEGKATAVWKPDDER
ncbi:MAG: hypothetical protein ABIU29_09240 [Chthoniobacterales bacterium]